MKADRFYKVLAVVGFIISAYCAFQLVVNIFNL